MIGSNDTVILWLFRRCSKWILKHLGVKYLWLTFKNVSPKNLLEIKQIIYNVGFFRKVISDHHNSLVNFFKPARGLQSKFWTILLWSISCKLFHVFTGHLYTLFVSSPRLICLHWVVYYWFTRVVYIFWTQGFCQVYVLVIFPPVLMGKSSKFWWNQINQFSMRVYPSEGPNFIWLGLLADY